MARPKAQPAQLNPVGATAADGVRGRFGGISETKVRQMIADGELEAVRIGRRVMVTEESIEALIERNRVGA
ncbi:helix-turn-helix domain-containing protein [Mycobacterium sp. M1]|uniref:Helix-turn-helix domain-containing protein n=1 Tax=Mycolicibacter acidiphilus TaxID=2835306 RepID=A0ABS5RDL3_9MYCO|nr:helix-turn-helix domain-containing protein [Mycolicibacter acidiphilus]MBS9532375.1 helix-turn-helix domain-containing protein [Mycolicibacter acidiphilus]